MTQFCPGDPCVSTGMCAGVCHLLEKQGHHTSATKGAFTLAVFGAVQMDSGA